MNWGAPNFDPELAREDLAWWSAQHETDLPVQWTEEARQLMYYDAIRRASCVPERLNGDLATAGRDAPGAG